MSVVLDACALIAYLNAEKGAERVEEIFRSGERVHMSCINLLEVAYDAVKSSRNPQAAHELAEEISNLPMVVTWDIPVDVFHEASRLKAGYRISLADAVAAAFTKKYNSQLATSDHHEFEHLASLGEVDVLWIR